MKFTVVYSSVHNPFSSMLLWKVPVCVETLNFEKHVVCLGRPVLISFKEAVEADLSWMILNGYYYNGIQFLICLFPSSRRFGRGQPTTLPLTLQLQGSPLHVALLPDVDPQPAGPGCVAPAKPHPERGGHQCQARGGGGGQEEGTLLTCHPSTPCLTTLVGV